MPGLLDLFQTIVSCSVDLCGNGAIRGGKSAFMAGARKVGWAKQGGDGRAGRRFGGHSIARKSLSSGGTARANLANYDPKGDMAQRLSGPYAQALASGSGAAGKRSRKSGPPPNLHGRNTFQAPQSPLGRNDRNYGCSRGTGSKSWSKNPRGFIKF